jgi:hypothetical protein
MQSTHIHARRHARTHTHTQTRAHARTPAHTHTHTQIRGARARTLCAHAQRPLRLKRLASPPKSYFKFTSKKRKALGEAQNVATTSISRNGDAIDADRLTPHDVGALVLQVLRNLLRNLLVLLLLLLEPEGEAASKLRGDNDAPAVIEAGRTPTADRTDVEPLPTGRYPSNGRHPFIRSTQYARFLLFLMLIARRQVRICR